MREHEYYGEINHFKSLIHWNGDSIDSRSQLSADIYHARDDKKYPYRIAIASCTGVFKDLQGKYRYCKSLEDAQKTWDELKS